MKAKERERMDVMYLMGLKKWQRCIECEWRSSASDVRIRPNIGANARIRKTSISIVYWTCEWNLRFSMMPRKFRIKPENHLASFIRLLCAIWECVFGSYKCAQCIRPYRVRRLYGSWEVQPVSIEISPDGLFILWCIDSNSRKRAQIEPHVLHAHNVRIYTQIECICVTTHNQMLGDIEHTKWYRCYFIEIENYRKSTIHISLENIVSSIFVRFFRPLLALSLHRHTHVYILAFHSLLVVCIILTKALENWWDKRHCH